jgi:hypothetical protein
LILLLRFMLLSALSPNIRQVIDFVFAFHAAFGTPTRASRTNANTALGPALVALIPPFPPQRISSPHV